MSAKRKTHVDEAAAKLQAKVLRAIKARLRDMERQAGINFVAFRLGIQGHDAAAMLAGEKHLTLEQMSDLALAVGYVLRPRVVALRKGES